MKYIKLFVAFLLPILGKAATRAIVDEAVKFAYPERPARQFIDYSKGAKATTERPRIMPEAPQAAPGFELYHDVLMVAFDITGPNVAVVKEFLSNMMPPAKYYVDHDTSIDSWWIADDTAGTSDCDSAIFVSKGNQEKARVLLALHGLV